MSISDIQSNEATFKLYDKIYWHPRVPGNVKDHLEDIKIMEIRPDDIIITTFPRSGTNWIGNIVKMLVKGSSEYPPDEGVVRMMDFNPVTALNTLESPRIMFTHMPCKYRPRDIDKARVIYVARNPKDAAVSRHCLYVNSKLYPRPYHNDWNKFIEDFMQGKGIMGSWFDHVLPWKNQADQSKNILFLKYEDLHKDLKKKIKQIAEFLEIPHDENLINAITKAMDFKAVKVYKNQHMPDRIKIMSKTGDHYHFRKGQVADWKNWLTVAQNEQFDQMYEEKMKDTGLTFDFIL